MARREGQRGSRGKVRSFLSSPRPSGGQAMERRLRAVERRQYWSLSLVAVLLCGLALLHTWTRVSVIERSRQLGEVKQEGERLTSELHRLKLEKATLASVRRVDSEARVRLGMHRPPRERLILLETLAPARLDSEVEDDAQVDLNARLPRTRAPATGTLGFTGGSR